MRHLDDTHLGLGLKVNIGGVVAIGIGAKSWASKTPTHKPI